MILRWSPTAVVDDLVLLTCFLNPCTRFYRPLRISFAWVWDPWDVPAVALLYLQACNSAHPLFSENSCELLRNSLHIRERDADTGTVFVCRPFGFVGRTLMFADNL